MPSPTNPRLPWRSLVALLVAAISAAGCQASSPPMRPQVGGDNGVTVDTIEPTASCAGDVCFPYADAVANTER
jgi:hypothetical protein